MFGKIVELFSLKEMKPIKIKWIMRWVEFEIVHLSESKKLFVNN